MAHEEIANREPLAADAIRAWRTGLKMSLRQLGELSGTSYAYISQIENGTREPTDRWLRDVEEALVNAALEMRRAS